MSPLRERLLRNMTKALSCKTCGRSPNKTLKKLMRAKRLMVELVINEKVQKFMVSLYKKEGHVSRSIAAATAIILLSRI